MGWSTQAAVVSGGRLLLPASAIPQSNIPNITAGSVTNSCVLVESGPALAESTLEAWMSTQWWSDTHGFGSALPWPHGANFQIVYVGTGGTPNLLAVFDISGLLLNPGVSGLPAKIGRAHV